MTSSADQMELDEAVEVKATPVVEVASKSTVEDDSMSYFAKLAAEG